MRRSTLALCAFTALIIPPQFALAKSKRTSTAGAAPSGHEERRRCRQPTNCNFGKSASASAGNIWTEISSANLGSGKQHPDVTDEILRISDTNQLQKIQACASNLMAYTLCLNATATHNEGLFEEYRWANRVFGVADRLLKRPESRAEMIAAQNYAKARQSEFSRLTSGGGEDPSLVPIGSR